MNIIKITFLIIILVLKSVNLYSKETINYEQKGFDFFVKWLDNNKVFDGDTSILFNKKGNTIFLSLFTQSFEIAPDVWNIQNAEFITLDSNKKLLSRYHSEVKIHKMYSKETFVKVPAEKSKRLKKRNGDMFVRICNEIKIGKFHYVVIGYDFGNFWSFELIVKLNENGDIIGYLQQGGVN